MAIYKSFGVGSVFYFAVAVAFEITYLKTAFQHATNKEVKKRERNVEVDNSLYFKIKLTTGDHIAVLTALYCICCSVEYSVQRMSTEVADDCFACSQTLALLLPFSVLQCHWWKLRPIRMKLFMLSRDWPWFWARGNGSNISPDSGQLKV